MRVAGRFVLTAIVTLLIAQSISGTVQPSDRDNEGQIDYVAVLCGRSRRILKRSGNSTSHAALRSPPESI
jgi:hypothetical protein